MGFDVNFNNKPIIQGAQSAHDGGAGNLGYFEQGEGESHKKNNSIFSEEGADTFKKSGESDEIEETFSIAKFIAKIILAIKTWFKKILGISD